MRKFKFLLLGVFILAFVLRFYQLGKVPTGLNLDEVAIGYDAYSVLKTGKDQFGGGTPAYFRSHDDYKPPLLIYLAVPATALFGETNFAVRFFSALLGVLAIVMVYFACKELFVGESGKLIGLVSAFLLTISPWHLQYSRTAYEVGMQPFLTMGAVYFLLRGLRRKEWWPFGLSAIFFGLGPYLYTASRVFVPLLVLALGAVYFRELLSGWKKTIFFAVIFLIFLLPLVYLFTTPAGQFRFKGTNIFQDPKAAIINDQLRSVDVNSGMSIFGRIYHPDKMAYFQELLFGYLAHFRPDFLFLGRDGPPTNYVPNVGLIYLIELPFLLAGFYYLYSRHDKKTAYLLTSWILLSPLPASVTYGVPTSIRVTIILPAIQIVIGYGIYRLYRSFSSKNIARLGVFIYTLLAGILFSYYLHMYYIHAPVVNSKYWYDGYEQVVQKALTLAPNYRQVIVSTSLDQPHSFFLFYSHYDPKTYLSKDGGTVSGGFEESRNHFDKYYFKPIDWGVMSKEKNTLFIGRPVNFPKNVNVLERYYYLDGSPSVIMVGT